jgi:cytochrome c2
MRISMRQLHLLVVVILLAAGCGATPPAETSGDAERGRQIFTQGVNNAPPCSTCHLVIEGEQRFSLGPNLAGVGERGGGRVEDLTAEDYIRQSILEPHLYIVPGYRDIMYPDFGEHLSDNDVTDLIAYLMTL